MESAIPASDQMEPVDSGRFRLLGRHADQVNIVGKRVSIRALEHAARSIPGCEDAAFLIDDTGEGRIPRAVAFIVLAKDTAIDHIREGLRSQLDPAFVPRTLIPVACIPRNRTGKVLRADLVALLSSTRKDDRRS
jgi:acyl-coenzyme A synthetase/AMP-(fatty) acid ligase